MSNEKIIEKIQKLFNLAGNNPNENEAKAALLKAQELMAKYNLDQDKLTGADKETIKYISISTTLTHGIFTDSLTVTISRSFACEPIVLCDKSIAIFGRKDNAIAVVSALEFAYSVMSKGAKMAADSYDPILGTKAEAKNSYCLGFCKGLKEAMDAQCVALAVVVPGDVKEGFKNKYPILGKARANRRVSCDSRSEAFSTGYKDGSTALNKRSITA